MKKIYIVIVVLCVIIAFLLGMVFALSMQKRSMQKGQTESTQITPEPMVITVNEEVKNSLHNYIYTRVDIFNNEFNLAIDRDFPYDMKYKGVMEGIYKHHYKKYHPEQFYGKLLRIFGRRTADNMIWLFEHWELWEKFCK